MDIQSISLTYGVAIGILLDGMYVFLFCLLNNRNQARLQRNLMYLAAIADSQPQPSMHSQVVGLFFFFFSFLLFYCFINSCVHCFIGEVLLLFLVDIFLYTVSTWGDNAARGTLSAATAAANDSAIAYGGAIKHAIWSAATATAALFCTSTTASFAQSVRDEYWRKQWTSHFARGGARCWWRQQWWRIP